MERLPLYLLGFALCFVSSRSLGIYNLGEEVLVNGNMQYDNWDSEYHWFGQQATLVQVPGLVGNAAAVTKKKKVHGQITQILREGLEPGYYYMEGYIKLLNHPEGAESFHMDMRYRYLDADSNLKFVRIADITGLRDTDGWVKIAGEFLLPANCSGHRVFFLSIKSIDLNFAVDEVSLKRVIPEDDWEGAANEMIDEYRKGEVNVNVNINYNIDPSYITFGVRQLSHDFQLGAHVWSQLINGNWKTEEIRAGYQEFFFDNFNSGTPTSRFKWHVVEKEEGVLNLDQLDKGVTKLIERGLKVVGSEVFWDQNKFGWPEWFNDKTSTERVQLMKKRVDDMVTPYNGKIDTYIVSRDNFKFKFQNATGDDEIVDKMFNWVESAGDGYGANLVLSEINALRMSSGTSAFAHRANTLKSKGHAIQIGAQGTFDKQFAVDPIRLMARFDILAQTELPIVVTRLAMSREDILKRAQDLETFLRVAFAHPDVEGITLDGFWDGVSGRPNSSLVDTDDFVINKAGWTLQRLFKKEWRSDGFLTLPEKYLAQQTASFRAFYGDYEMDVMVDGEVVDTRTFSVHKGVNTVINVDIDEPSR
ncbi:unnamed protein product [Owenia fusiformis]|uniref:Uncharacterized protein n=1 Tax=Owenia fusiformis TaxID=6347 RepID=A0A8J1Y3E1_OWEFU|nr:unnamed protein product [Owenia fusiformis]